MALFTLYAVPKENKSEEREDKQEDASNIKKNLILFSNETIHAKSLLC